MEPNRYLYRGKKKTNSTPSHSLTTVVVPGGATIIPFAIHLGRPGFSELGHTKVRTDSTDHIKATKHMKEIIVDHIH